MVGDPFALVSLAFPMRSLETAYAFTYLLRLFAAQVVAYLYMRSIGARAFPSILGSLAYVFTTFTLFSALRHPFFATAMVMLPLLLIGIEQALVERKPGVLVAAVCVATFANFYFFYQLTIVVVVYAVARYVEVTPRGSRLRDLPSRGGPVAGYYLLGVALAAVALVPMLVAAFGSSRAAGSHAPAILASISDYRSYLVGLTTSRAASNSAFQGFSIVAVLLVPALLAGRKGHGALKFMVAVYPLMLVTPWVGYVFNGLMFASYRFLFAWGIFVGAAAAVVLSSEDGLSRRQFLWMAGSLAVYAAALGLVDPKVSNLARAQLLVGAGALVALALKHRPAVSERRAGAQGFSAWVLAVLLGLVLVGIGLNAIARYSPRFSDDLREYSRPGPFSSSTHGTRAG